MLSALEVSVGCCAVRIDNEAPPAYIAHPLPAPRELKALWREDLQSVRRGLAWRFLACHAVL